MRVTLYEGLAGLPPFDPGIEPEEASASVHDLQAQIKAADGVIICTPEYAHGMPGILKNALEWTVASGEVVDPALTRTLQAILEGLSNAVEARIQREDLP